MQNKIVESVSNMALLMLLLMAAVSYEGRLFGYEPKDLFDTNENRTKVLPPNKTQLKDMGLTNVLLHEEMEGKWLFGNDTAQEVLVNSLAFSKGIYGYAGRVPMYLYLDEKRRIKEILLLENSETPEFLESIKTGGVVKQWIGKTFLEIEATKPDVVSGATLTSNAINETVRASMAAVEEVQVSEIDYGFFSTKTIAAFLVVISGLIVSFRAKNNKNLRTVQLVLNVVVLGFWCGKFISLNILLGWVSNGMNIVTSSVIFAMLVLSVAMPLFFKKGKYYCNWVCPLGAVQELAGKLNPNKIQPNQSVLKVLKHLKTTITLALFFSMWMGVATDIVDYEPFSAFLFAHASPVVLAIAAVSLLLAVVTPRPWCRFACPTGQILTWTNKMD